MERHGSSVANAAEMRERASKRARVVRLDFGIDALVDDLMRGVRHGGQRAR